MCYLILSHNIDPCLSSQNVSWVLPGVFEHLSRSLSFSAIDVAESLKIYPQDFAGRQMLRPSVTTYLDTLQKQITCRQIVLWYVIHLNPTDLI